MTAGKLVTFRDKDYLENEFIDLASAPNDEYLRGDGTWQTPATIVGTGLLLDTLGDVNLTTPADDDILTYDSASSKWINEPIPIPPGLSSTSDVNFNALTLTGNLTVQGVTTTVDSSTMTVVDPIITLQTASGGGALAADSNKDVGIAMQYHTGSAAKTAFLGFDDSETKLTFIPDATINSEVVSGTKGTIVANLEGNVTGNADTVTNGLYTTNLGVTVQAYDVELAAIAGLTSAANKGIQFTGSGTASTYDLTAAGKALLDDPDVATQRLTLGLGSIATHSLSSVLALMQQKIPQINARTERILKTGLGTAANYDLSSLLGLLGEPRLPSYISSTTRDILKSGLGTISTHSLSSVLAMMSTQVPRYLQHLDSASVSILKSGLGSIATHSLSSVMALMSQQKTLLDLKDTDLTGVATNDIIVHNGIKWVNQAPATARLSLGLGTVATHSLSSVLALASNQNSYGDKTEKILKRGLGTIASKDFATVMMAFDHRTSLKTLSDTVIDSQTLADNDFLIFNASDSKWYNRSTSTSRTKMGVAIGTDVQAHDAALDSLALVSSATGNFIVGAGGGGWTAESGATARASLGLGSIATKSLATVLAMTQASGSAAAGTSTSTSTNIIYILLEAGGGLGGQQLENEADTDNTNFILMPDTGHSYSSFPLTSQDIGVDVQAYDATILVDADIGSTVQAYDATILTSSDIGSTVQAYDAELAAIAGLTSAVDKGIQFTGSGSASTYDLTAAGKALLDDADAAAQRTTLGISIGSDVQAYDAELAAIAGLTSAADKGIQFTGSGTAATYDLTTAGKALLDDADATAQRTTLGLAIGSNVQAHDVALDSLAAVSSATGNFIVGAGGGGWQAESGTTARTSLGLGSGDSPSFVTVSATGTGSLKVPAGTTAQQAGSQGGIRYNTTDSAFEGYDGSAWAALGGGGGAPAEQISDATSSTATLEGTYTETMMIADTFNVSGTVTLAAGFYMSKITDDGQPVIISGSGTLTGTGTMASRFPFAADSPKVNRKNLGLGHQGDGIATRSLAAAMMLGQSWGAITNRTLPAQPTDFVSKASGGTFGGDVSIGSSGTSNLYARDIKSPGGNLTLNTQQANQNINLTPNGVGFINVHGGLNTYAVLPASTTTYDIGSPLLEYSNVYATNFNGRATSANWSDLAEKYEADRYYDEGTVLAIGGEKEVTEYVKGKPYAGVVSIKPGLRMNDKREYEDNPNYPYVCLKGRIPVKINGKAKKGDYIIADDRGKGKSIGIQPQDMYNLIGISLEDGVDIIEVKV